MRYHGIEVDDAVVIAEKIDINVPEALTLIPDVVGEARRVANHANREGRFWEGGGCAPH